MMRIISTAMALIFLAMAAGCATTPEPEIVVIREPACVPALMAPVEPQPDLPDDAMPGGNGPWLATVTATALWGREGWARIAEARVQAGC